MRNGPMKHCWMWMLVCVLGITATVASTRNAATLAAQTPPASAFDWPQWQGPDRSGVSRETGLLPQWPASGPPLAWSISGLGSGYGSLAMRGDRIFVQSLTSAGSGVTSLNRADGTVVWTR